MNQSFVKMMNRIAEVENYILKGLVLDEHGEWIPIADKRAVEEDFLAHLSAGQVLHEARWVSIAEAKAARAPTEIATAVVEIPAGQDRKEALPDAPAAAAVVGEESPEETKDILITRPEEETRAAPAPSKGAGTPVEGVDFPPETKSISLAPAVDPESGFAPETGLFVVDQADGAAPAQQEGAEPAPPETDFPAAPEKALSAGMPQALSSWEKDAQKSRKRIILFGSVLAGLAGIAALVVIISQVVR